jgi:P-type Mg2+ transporter
VAVVPLPGPPRQAKGRESSSEAHSQEDFWQISLQDLFTRLGASPAGLTATEAKARLVRHGPNRIVPKRALSLARKIAGHLANPLVLVLLFAACVSAFTGDRPSFFIIISVVVMSIALDSVQERRADKAVERLRATVALTERALRDGSEVSIAAEDLVPGDVVLLAAGDLVPADGRLIEARDFFVNESLLTGESYPSEKQATAEGIMSPEVNAAKSAAFMGTSVVSGSGKLLVCATGQETELGLISRTLRSQAPPGALEQGTRNFGMLVLRLTVLLVLFILLVNLLLHRPRLESFLFALAIAVGLTPELLPMIVSVTLAQGATRLAKLRIIVKRPAAIHDLGSMDVLCTDKTGTLTEAKMSLARCVSLSGRDSDHVLDLAWLNSNFESGLRSPLDIAVLEHGPRQRQDWIKLDEVPFDFERRRVSVMLEREGRRILCVKGAPEDVLKVSSHYEEPGREEPVPLDQQALTRANASFEQASAEGFRVLAVAWRELDVQLAKAEIKDERGLIFAGFAAFIDPPKASAAAAIGALSRLGVKLKVLTGDNEHVTRHICNQLGIAVSAVLTGAELRDLSDEALAGRLEETTLFCRVTPTQKDRVILALKRHGHIVGFLGDGINDAPSLHTADAGISVDSAVDVAKDAADIILLDRDLGVLERGVREGRRTFGNIIKYVMMATSSNLGNMFSMAAASLLLPFLPMRPVQVLLNNLLYDVSELPIPLDQVDEEAVSEPRHWDMRFIRDFMLCLGPVSSVFDLLTFAVLLLVFHAGEQVFQTGWFVESLATQTLVIFIIRTPGNPLRSRPNPLLAMTSCAVVVFGTALPYTPMGHWFGFVSPPATFLLALAGIVVAYLGLAQLVKTWFFRLHTLRSSGHAVDVKPRLPLLER